MSFALLWIAQVLETALRLVPFAVVVAVVMTAPPVIYRELRKMKKSK